MVGTKTGAIPKTAVKAVKAKKPRSKKGNSSHQGAPVSTAARVKGQTGRAIREQGTDQLDLVNIAANYSGIAMQVVFTPPTLPRLGQLAKSFQRIKYHRLRFEVITGCPSSAGGVYVTGFVKDATDPLNAVTASSTLLASGGQAVKVWQSTEVVVTSLPDLFYTSGEPSEERWSSPGSFVVAFVAAPSQAMTIQVFVHWDVSLSQPTYESREQGSGFITVTKDLYSSTNNKYLSVRKGQDWEPATGAHFDPPMPLNSYATLLSMRYAPTQNSTGALSGIFGYRQIVIGDNNYVYPVDDKKNRSTLNFDSETYGLFKGERIEMEVSKNSLRASWFLSARHPRNHSPEQSDTECASGGSPLRNEEAREQKDHTSLCRPLPRACSTTIATSSSADCSVGMTKASTSASSTSARSILLDSLIPFLTQLRAETGSASLDRLTERPRSSRARSRKPSTSSIEVLDADPDELE